jgi:outer membrane protein TolC
MHNPTRHKSRWIAGGLPLQLCAVVLLGATGGCRSIRQARSLQNPASMQRGERTVSLPELALPADGWLPVNRAVQLAISNSPAVFQARTGLAVAETQLQQARASYLPQVSLDAGHTVQKQYNPAWPSSDRVSGRASLDLNLCSFGRQEAALRQARAEHAAAAAHVQGVVNTTAYETRTACFALLAAQELLVIAEEKVREFDIHLRQVQAMVELGTRIRYDSTKAEVDLGSARLECLQASNTVQEARAALARVLGLTEELPPARLAWGTIPTVVGTEAISNLYRFARSNHPDCEELQARVAAASAAVDFAVADLYPDLSFGTTVSASGHDLPLNWGWNLGPSLGWSAFAGWRKTAALEGTTRQLQASRSRLTAREQQLFQELITARMQLQTARAQGAVAEMMVRSARESLELVSARYALGLATAVELTDAEVAVAQARKQQVEARRSGLAAYARLRQHTGEHAWMETP